MKHVYVIQRTYTLFDSRLRYPKQKVQMFVKVSGLSEAGIDVPEQIRTSANNSCDEKSVTLALVRWLTPHLLALSRDDALRPLCPPPFDINHALWTFAKIQHQRPYFSDNLFARQLNLFTGHDRATQRQHANTLKYTCLLYTSDAADE